MLVNYGQNDYNEHYKDLNLFFKEYVGDELMTPFIFYPDLKTKYPIEVIDLRHQHDHKTPKKINYSMNMVMILRMQGFL